MPGAFAAPPVTLLEAVRSALQRNASIQVSELQVRSARGRLMESASPFDTNLFASGDKQRTETALTDGQLGQFPPGIDAPSSVVSDVTTTTLGVSRLLRSGITIQPSISNQRVSDTLSHVYQEAQAVNRPVYTLKVTVPLLRNPGRDVAYAGERAAEQEVEATRNDLGSSVSQSAFNVTQAFWGVIAAQRSLAIAREAEGGSERRAGDVEKLIAADRMPAADRALVTADRAQKRSTLISAEQGLVEAKSALGRAIGLSAPETFSMPELEGDYPEPNAAADDVLNRLPQLRAAALESRPELRSAQLRLDQARIALESARASLKPQLDLGLSVGSSGLQEGNGINDYWTAYAARLRGPNAGITVTYQFPWENRAATGQLTQRMATFDQATVQQRDLRDSILTTVETTAHSVRGLALQLVEARNAVALYERSVANEETKRKLGSGTLIDVINVSDRLLQTRLSLNSARYSFAVAVAQLRLATGTILQRGAADAPSEFTIDLASLTQVPR